MNSMQFYVDLLCEILGESAPSSKALETKAIRWSKNIVTDAQDVYDKVSTEKGGLPQQVRVRRNAFGAQQRTGGRAGFEADPVMSSHCFTWKNASLKEQDEDTET